MLKISHLNVIGLKYENGIKDSDRHAWFANPGYVFHNLISQGLETIQSDLTSPNGVCRYYYSPVPVSGSVPESIKYVMGILSEANAKKWISDAEIFESGSETDDEKELLNSIPQYFGIADQRHVQLRKSIGFAWPLISGTVNSVPDSLESNNDIYYGLSGGFINTKTKDISLDTNVDNILLNTTTLNAATPEIWNIPYIRTENDETDIRFSINDDDIPVSELWNNVKYPSAIIKYYNLNNTSDTSEIKQTFDQQFLNLDNVWSAYKEKFVEVIKDDSINDLPTLKMTVTTEIDLSDTSNMRIWNCFQ